MILVARMYVGWPVDETYWLPPNETDRERERERERERVSE